MTVEKVIVAGLLSTCNGVMVSRVREYEYIDARGMGVRMKFISPLVKYFATGSDQHQTL
ncbi:MAG: hypothetical protein OXE41_02590 [Gammaproteobacteria bacterium]|nr:hypothetical protein [Gammaproteobacteria bacterium]MCY4274271.1 hypothetical protein [Gammaproteobacteria bacterium]